MAYGDQGDICPAIPALNLTLRRLGARERRAKRHFDFSCLGSSAPPRASQGPNDTLQKHVELCGTFGRGFVDTVPFLICPLGLLRKLLHSATRIGILTHVCLVTGSNNKWREPAIGPQNRVYFAAVFVQSKC